MADTIRNYVETQGTDEEKEAYRQMNLLDFKSCQTARTCRGNFDRPHEIRIFNSPEVGLQIWRYNASQDQNWECIVGGVIGWNRSANGFGDNSNIYAWTMKEFNESLYVGTFNVKRENITLNLKDLIKYIMTKGNLVYLLGAHLVTKQGNGCQVWKTDDGTHWIKVVGNETNDPGDGFGDINNNGIRSMSVYQINNTNTLIIGTTNAVTGCEIWKYQ